MTLLSDTDPVVASLGAFAALPEWLAAPMDGARVGDSLVRHVPELADGRLTLLSCTPQRLRAKDQEWVARYQLSVSPRGAEPRDVVLVGNLWAPSQQPSPSRRPATTSPSARRAGPAGCPTCGWPCATRRATRHCRRCRCSSSPRRRHSCCSPSSAPPATPMPRSPPASRWSCATNPAAGAPWSSGSPTPTTASRHRPHRSSSRHPGRQGPDGVGGDDRALEGLVVARQAGHG